MLDDLCVNTVTVTKFAWANVKGVRTPSVSSTMTRRASVQPMRARDVERHGIAGDKIGYTVYFAVDPGIKIDDQITWSGTVLSVLGPAKNAAGRGICWSVPCQEVR